MKYNYSMATELEGLAKRAQRQGWAVGSGTIDQVQSEAQSLGWIEVPIRRGDPTVVTLRSLGQAAARPKSMSAQYGLEEQPLHTDGAHLLRPPDVVVLSNTDENSTHTRLWRPSYSAKRLNSRIPSIAQDGIFLVHSGKDSFFCTAEARGRLRYDPACMTPCDARARRIATFFQKISEGITEHAWSQPNMLLVINNRRTLHGRASAINDPDRELQRISFYIEGEQS
ncbi:TauD/TfdA family dioxygenase [Spirillospora albida]|uniref:TauD/TfdA family dioxygenase n=1 Tax=Spirillospora albida TaxID=58123 RepID=UPI0012FAF055|nr:TauD/TfdA family dioxygenase [Spirillospora albida]